MKLYDEFKDRRKDFEILAFHDNRASDLADLDAKLQPVRDEVWGGRDLPFPILMDSTGETLRTFGINAFPTIVAIDPEGKVVRGGDESSLRDYLLSTDPAVKKLLKKLKGAKGERFGQAVDEVAVAGKHASYALSLFAGKHAKPDQVPVVAGALRRIGGPYAIGFFLGQHGLASNDKKARLEAADALGEIGVESTLLWFSQFLGTEQDDDVKKALAAAMEKIQGR